MALGLTPRACLRQASKPIRRSNETHWGVVAVAVLLLNPVFGTAATIHSSSIYPADGTTGQSLTTGDGVKTGHIQDGAITSQKLADGAVTASKIANGAIGNAQIAAGAITDSQISGPISASKLAPHSHVISDVQELEARLASKASRYANVVVVATAGGDYPNPVDALGSINDASAANPYLVKIMPGQYALTAPLIAQPFVEIEGSGQGVTRLLTSSTVQLAPGTDIRDLSIELTAGSAQVVGSGILTDVTVTKSATAETYAPALRLGDALLERAAVSIDAVSAQGGDLRASGPLEGLRIEGRVTMRDCRVTASSTALIDVYAISVQLGELLLDHGSEVIASSTVNGVAVVGVFVTSGARGTVRRSVITSQGVPGGLYAVNSWGTAVVEGSALLASQGYAIQGNSGIATVLNTRVNGIVQAWTGTLRCFGLYADDASPVICQ